MITDKEAARQAYYAHKAPSEYYEERWMGSCWNLLPTVSLFYCWLSDGTPAKQQHQVPETN